MNGSGSSSRCVYLTTSSTKSSAGSGTTYVTSVRFGASTCTSRSPSSVAGRRGSSRRSSARFPRPRPGRARSGSRLLATARRGASACSSSRTTVGVRARLAGEVQERLKRLSVYRREGRPWLPHLTVARWRERPRLRLEPPPARTFVPSDAAAYLSRLHPAGARYEVLESVALGG